jgi:hypothetical protein
LVLRVGAGRRRDERSGVCRGHASYRAAVRAEQVIVSIDLDNGYTDEVRQVINGGVRTTFTYDVDLKMIVPAWVDRTIATAVITTTTITTR